MSRYQLAGSFLIIFVLGLTSRLLGFLREMVLAAVFGAAEVTDAYTITFAIPSVLFAVVGAAITTVLIPMLTRYRATGREQEFEDISWTVFHGLLIFLTAVLTVTMLEVDGLVRAFAPGFSGRQMELARRLALIMLPGLVFMGLNGWMQGVLNSCRNFVAPAAASIPMNVVLIVGTYFFGRAYGIEAVAWASLAAMTVQVLWQWSALRKVGLRYKPTFQWRHPDLLAAVKRTGPVVMALGAVQLSQVVDRMLASGLPAGSASALTFANRIYSLPLGLLVMPLLTVLYPELTDRAARQDMAGFGVVVNRGLRLLLFLMVPISAGLILLRVEVTALVFQRGRFDYQDTLTTSFALLFYAIGLTGFAWREMLARAMYSIGDTWTPASTGAMSMVLNVVMSVILVRYLAHGGIALSTSLAIWWGAVVLLVRIRHRVGWLFVRSLVDGVLKALGATAVMAGVVVVLRAFVFARLDGSSTDTLVLAAQVTLMVISGTLAYAGMLYVFRVEERTLLIEIAHKAMARLLQAKARRTRELRKAQSGEKGQL